MDSSSERAAIARALFKRFLAEHWFGGPDFETWIRDHLEHEPELRALRDEWLAELGDPESPGLVPPGERALRSLGSFAPGDVLGGFRLKARIGAGASSEVWEAEELALGSRRVALKLLRPDLIPDPRALERFRREAVAGSIINHPGVVAVYSVGRPLGQPIIAMELVEGGATLATLVQSQRERGGPDAAYWRRVCELVAQAAEALAAAHALGILHRDVKPQNVLVTRDGRAKVADFGLAHLAGEHSLSQSGDVMGTFCYMSPAQVRGEVKALQPSTDVFSLGATLYELLTLRRAFPGTTLAEISHRIVHEDPPSARTVQPRLPAHLAMVCAKALEKRPADRLPMSELAAELRRFLAGEPTHLRETTFVGRALKWSRRHPTTSVAGSVALAGALAFAWLGAVRAEEGQRAELEILHTRALYALELGDLEEAVAWVEAADELDASDPTGHLILATGYARGGRTVERDAHLAEARARGFHEDPARLDTALEHASHALHLQSLDDLARYPEMEAHIARALELDPRLYALEYVRYQACNARDDRAGAAAALRRLHGHLRASDPFTSVVEALILEVEGEPRAALASLEELRARVEPAELPRLRWNRHAGRMCVVTGDWERAEELLRLAVEEAPGDCWSWDHLAVACLERLRGGEDTPALRARALEYAARALECAPSLENAYLVRAWVALLELEPAARAGDPRDDPHWELAREALEAVQVRHPGGSPEARRLESHLHFLEALPHYRAGRHEEAAELYELALELDPRNLRALALLGQCYYHGDETELGLAVLADGLALWDGPRRGEERDPRWLGALLAWTLGLAAKLGDETAYEEAKLRLVDALEHGVVFQDEELFTAAEFLATAPPELRDCALAHALLTQHGLRTAFEGTANEAQARRDLARIDASCPREQ